MASVAFRSAKVMSKSSTSSIATQVMPTARFA